MKFRTLLALPLLVGCATTTQQQNLTDPQIAMILRVVNLGEVREGELAREKSGNAPVREFGAMMVSEHTSQNNKAESELSRVNIASEDTPLSRQIDAASGAATDRLRDLTGLAFDRGYIDRQVEAHQYVLGLIDSKLLPTARKKILRDQLADLRKMLDAHLTRAKQIQASLSR
jgi:putative membrane protein